MRRAYLDVDGIRMSWLEQGRGTPLVLIHGIPTSPELWRHVIPLLKKVHVFAWEMVGYGKSIAEGRARDISVGNQALYLAAWMKARGIEKAVLAGHDLGGGVAQIVAVREPGLCGGLFLTNSIGYDSWPIPSVAALKATAPLLRHLPDVALKLLLTMFYHRGHDDSGRAMEAYRTHAPNYLASGGFKALAHQVECLRTRDTLEIAGELARLSVPARIVWGAADQFQKLNYAERIARDLQAPLERIEGGKHFTPEDHPDTIAAEIMKLVAETKRSGR